MFNFTATPPAATTAANSPFTFSPSTTSQPWNTFGTSTTAQPSVFGLGAQHTSTIRPFGNPPTSTTPANFTPTNLPGASVFGMNQAAAAAAAQPKNIFGSNLPGTTVKFSPASAQAPFSTPSTTSNMFGSNNTTTTTTTSPFGVSTSSIFGTPGSVFNQPFSTVPSTSTAPFTFGTSVTPTTNVFGPSTSTIINPFNITKPTAPVTTTIINPFNITKPTAPVTTTAINPFNITKPTAPVTTTTINPFNVKPSITPSPFNFSPNTSTSTPSIFGPQPVPNTSIFSQSTGPTPFSSTNATTTPAFPTVNSVPSTSATTDIFGRPIITTATTGPTVNNFVTQPTVPTTVPFSFALAATSLLGTNTLPSTTASTFNPPLSTGLSVSQTQPAATSSSSTILSQVPTQEQHTQQSVSFIQQQFLAASLLDPYANRGKKDFTNIDQIHVPTEAAVVSTLSTTTPIPITLPIQSNFRKTSPSRSLVDVNFKLKPVSSSPTLNDELKSSNQQSMISTGQIKSTLTGNFTDEEELVLLGRTKMSKLRLSNGTIDSSYQSNAIRSLYPLRRLTELEKLTNITPSSSPATTVNHERTSHSSNENRDVSPSHRSTSSITPKQLSSPIIQHKPNTISQTYDLPILTRDNYYTKPTISELKSSFNDKGQCILKQFIVGHEKYGSVTFYGQINVAGLNLDEIIEINHQEVIVYPDDNNKPSVGEGLNLPARITLLGVYPIDRATQEEITDIERIKAMNYNAHLRELTKKFDGQFINYGVTEGSWTFMVQHFTRYGLDDNQNDFVIQSQVVDN